MNPPRSDDPNICDQRCEQITGFPDESSIMGFLAKLFRKQPPARVRICVECGMPIAEHKDWCSILRTQQELAGKTKPNGE